LGNKFKIQLLFGKLYGSKGAKMKRRLFMKWTAVGMISGSLLPLYADKIFAPVHSKALDDLLKKNFADKQMIWSDKIMINVPERVTIWGRIPVRFKSDLDAKKIMVYSIGKRYFTLSGTYYVPDDAIVDYFLKVKMRSEDYRYGRIVVFLEDRAGDIYCTASSLFKNGRSGACAE
jgi:hypothetical protein